MSGVEAHYSAHNIEDRLLRAIREAGLDPETRLLPDQLGSLDHFHTGGLQASLELLDLAKIRAGSRVVDIGAGLGGSARLLTSRNDCSVVCIELSSDFCAGARLLNRLTGHEDRISVHQGSATDMPFPDGVFDCAWMQNVGMNIEDKAGLYAEVRRVLKPGGRFAFQEMAAGSTGTSYFPLPWATDPGDSFLISAEAMLSLLEECGFATEAFEDTSDMHLARSTVSAAPSALTLGVFVDNLAEKAGNARRSLQEGQVRLVRGVFLAK